ncbi:MAG: DUF58 domain-containing protein, partial [Pseudomonadota bacterium]
ELVSPRAEPVDPQVLAQLRDLALVARRVVEGMLSGSHASRQRGAGLEFNQYRTYEPGDDPSRIDWQLYARSDRYFVREAQRESQLTLWCFLDLTRSMGQRSEQIAGWDKLAYAKALCASLAWLALRQGDAFGLLGMQEERLYYLPCRRGRRHYDRFCSVLSPLDVAGTWPQEATLHGVWEHLRSPGLAVLVTDLFEYEAEISRLASKLATAGKDVLVVQLLTAAERDFPWTGERRFRDRESGEERVVEATRHAGDYRARREADTRRLAREFTARDVDFRQAVIEDPLEAVLAACLERRPSRVV